MNRLIKFRGKRTDTGEWICGFYREYQIYQRCGKCLDHINYFIDSVDGGSEFVNPETVGQFTGLLDKNGKEIYEGDIVMWGHLNDGWSNETPHRKAIVKLFPTLHFLAFTETEFGTPHAFYYDSFAYKDTQKYLEVIGNEFDNHELLRGGKE